MHPCTTAFSASVKPATARCCAAGLNTAIRALWALGRFRLAAACFARALVRATMRSSAASQSPSVNFLSSTSQRAASVTAPGSAGSSFRCFKRGLLCTRSCRSWRWRSENSLGLGSLRKPLSIAIMNSSLAFEAKPAAASDVRILCGFSRSSFKYLRTWLARMTGIMPSSLTLGASSKPRPPGTKSLFAKRRAKASSRFCTTEIG
mmetsp:Transcript_37344/g.107929  ORF Transcript_37344/g.107929 Transcript_37344/m.107929 type:complete len:205 (-) Transcript_37344:151-765(-)